ncbi:MAG TPA: anhydro-N-acetylmuramic acid kinase [Alphaproteobacteria bacterium]
MSVIYRVIGLMSGSSLDGLDIACCDFSQVDGTWRFSIPHAVCKPYSDGWVKRLREAHHMAGKDLWQLHVDFGRYSGEAVRDFIAEHKIADTMLVGSHGHTVFHFPQDGFTTQIGDGAALAVAAGIPVACDFRSTDIARGGQGAPLVPIGDKLLFGDYKFLLNLGGIANVTMQGNETVAFDICSANQVLNFYAYQKGQVFDKDGAFAAQGKFDQSLFDALNALDYHKQPYPKSLDNGYSRDVIIPLMEKTHLSVEDKLHTFCEHIAYQIAAAIKAMPHAASDKLMASGGGVFNSHLMERIKHYAPVMVVRPDDAIIHYKEALVFAFIGLLRWLGEENVLASVTGAKGNSIAGAIYLS